MSRKSIQEEAIALVPAFEPICEKVTRKFVISGKSQSCVLNYLRQISKLVLHTGQSPLELSIDELEEYLFFLRQNEKPSLSSFKHLVYGLRHVYAIYEKDHLELSLPEIKQSKALPVVLSKEEIRRLLKAPRLQKHRVLLGTIYDGGLRISEVCKLLITDVDFDRKVIHIRESKHQKDRYVPVSDMLVRGLKDYLATSKPRHYLFNGKQRGTPISREGIRHLLRAALTKCKITKKVCVHSLRHSYATHLLEDGLNIVTVRDLLGHTDIKTTMMYMHIAQVAPTKGYGPLTTLFPGQQ